MPSASLSGFLPSFSALGGACRVGVKKNNVDHLAEAVVPESARVAGAHAVQAAAQDAPHLGGDPGAPGAEKRVHEGQV